MAPIAKGKIAPPTMLMISKEEAMGGAFLRVASDKLKIVGNRILMKNCSAMSNQNPVSEGISATMLQMMAAMSDVPKSNLAGDTHRIKKVPVNRPIMNSSSPKESPVAATDCETCP